MLGGKNQTMGQLFNVTPRQITTWIAHLKKSGTLLWASRAELSQDSLGARTSGGSQGCRPSLPGPDDPKRNPERWRQRSCSTWKKSSQVGWKKTSRSPRRIDVLRQEGDFQILRTRKEEKLPKPRGITLVQGPAPALLEYRRRQSREDLARRIRRLFKPVDGPGPRPPGNSSLSCKPGTTITNRQVDGSTLGLRWTSNGSQVNQCGRAYRRLQRGTVTHGRREEHQHWHYQGAW